MKLKMMIIGLSLVTLATCATGFAFDRDANSQNEVNEGYTVSETITLPQLPQTPTTTNPSDSKEEDKVTTKPQIPDPIPGEDEKDDGIISDEVPDETPNVPDEEVSETVAPFNVEVSYQNSQSDGNGTTLWTVLVQFDGKNATQLLEQDGLYLAWRIAYTDEYGETGWYSVIADFTVSYGAGDYQVFYGLPNITKSIQFAVIQKAPEDSNYGEYTLSELDEDDILYVSEVFENEHFIG